MHYFMGILVVLSAILSIHCVLSAESSKEFRVEELSSDSELILKSETKTKKKDGFIMRRVNCARGCVCSTKADTKACATNVATNFFKHNMLSCRTNTDCWLGKLKKKFGETPKSVLSCVKRCALKGGSGVMRSSLALLSVGLLSVTLRHLL